MSDEAKSGSRIKHLGNQLKEVFNASVFLFKLYVIIRFAKNFAAITEKLG
jgi:hypothetical protein